MTPQNTSDTGERVSTFVSTLAYFEGQKFRIIWFLWAEMKVERVIGIEPNEHRIPRFLGKYSYHTHLPENPPQQVGALVPSAHHAEYERN